MVEKCAADFGVRFSRRLATKNIKLLRPTLFNYLSTREEFEDYTKELFDFMMVDKMNVQIHEIYPMEDVARAHNVSECPNCVSC